ncbi:cation:proton antiporter [Dysgonomonas sp. Marseille-P4677]|uniref:cation:proton antiporter n=1 Tax=Dysgonomonas sp. Marseille-P4677 TaxID=2364790 RepID=UPI001911FF80|nr:cation:proton antiporter [Dysgonomonas sp. Marseille-P4677]MBK5722341.1 cation:proton antiporter [Dysgonomonas sp. Marseille-P4677]
MTHLPPIISDLAFLLIVAGIVTIIFKWLKQPVVLGYIIAGFLTGPHSNFFPSVSNTESINIWGEIGVIFLLFGMGLEFSFKKLISNGKTGFITLVMIIIGLGVSGYFLGMWMGWGQSNSLILGCMLCLSSTTIIVKGFEDPRYKGKRFTEVVFGILIFDDLFAILVMVFLGTIAVSRNLEGTDILFSSGKLFFFMVVWVVCGILLIPTFLKKVKRWLNDETLLIISLGLCLGMVVFATEVELSSALGAFVMGSILAETLALESIERVTKPIKDFFGAIFFVSVGMLMDPSIVANNLTSIVLISILVLVGKIIFTALGARLSGESMLVSTQAGFSMAQVGEFAFIVAGTAITYRLADNFIYPIIIAVSILTTFTTPYLMAISTSSYNFMMRKIPKSWQERIIEKDKRLATPASPSLWNTFLRNYIFKMIIFTSLSIAIIVLSFSFLLPFLLNQINETWANIICLVVTLLTISLTLKGLVYKGGEQPYLISKLWKMNLRNKVFISIFSIIKYSLAFGFIYFILQALLNISVWLLITITLLLFLLLLKSKFLLNLYWKIEYRFILNFNQRAIDEKRKRSKQQEEIVTFDWDNESWIEQNLYVGRFKLEASSNYENVKLKDTDFRSKYGLLIVDVYRDKKELFFPNGDFILQANDIITVVGNIIQINLLTTTRNKIKLYENSLKTIHEFAKEQERNSNSKIKCVSLMLDKNSGLLRKSLLESEIGKYKECFVVGIERSNGYEINPSASTIFHEEDIIWIIGNKESVSEIVQANFHF